MNFIFFNMKGEHIMKRSEMKNIKRANTLGLGTHEVVFNHIQYREDENEEIIGAFVHIEGFKSLYIPVFETKEGEEDRNYQLQFLIDQLGVDNCDEDEINTAKGTVIKVTRYEKGVYTNTSFNPNPTQASGETLA